MIWIPCKLLDPKCKPTRQTAGAVGYDLVAREVALIEPGKVRKVPLGVCLAIPSGYFAEIRPRSGLTLKGIIVQLGTIDSDYRGELHAIVYNTERENADKENVVSLEYGHQIQKHERIAQLVILPVISATFSDVEMLDETVRGTGGFGSTG